jgi:hypothetical protein
MCCTNNTQHLGNVLRKQLFYLTIFTRFHLRPELTARQANDGIVPLDGANAESNRTQNNPVAQRFHSSPARSHTAKDHRIDTRDSRGTVRWPRKKLQETAVFQASNESRDFGDGQSCTRFCSGSATAIAYYCRTRMFRLL